MRDVKGLAFAASAYLLRGFQPIYWKQMLVWSFPILIVFLVITRQFRSWFSPACQFQIYKVYSISALLLGCNFFLCLWAVNAGHVLQVGLGFFINPLVSVLLGVVFLKERLPMMQWVAIGIAVIGVVVETIGYGEFPWISLSIASVFGFYGLVQKKASLTGLQGVSIELLLLSIPCLISLIILEIQGTSSFGHSGAKLNWLMVGCGLATILPQLCFATALETIPLTTIGLIQFMTPSIQVILMYHEKFSTTKAIGFGCVRASLILFTYLSLRDKFKASNDPSDNQINSPQSQYQIYQRPLNDLK
ncbi:DMT superfamily transporter protein RarD [Thraustotheca clavata]|uniref:DMT superfamily transporter protein RarD n=1 Tax=Thraustotheca clavata TaxID=74557 RepID=A0A1V9YV65_9STRA|nr:DMT superfamily transporter protein RarD [Thraustotheca clavata]